MFQIGHKEQSRLKKTNRLLICFIIKLNYHAHENHIHRTTPAGKRDVIRQNATCAPVHARSQTFRSIKVGSVESYHLTFSLKIITNSLVCKFSFKLGKPINLCYHRIRQWGHLPLVFHQPSSLFWRFSMLPHKEYECAHVLVRV